MNNDNIEEKIDKLPFFKKPKEKQEENKEPKLIIDTIQEQIEAPMTTIFCPQSLNEKELKKVYRNPKDYIEINIIKKIRIVDSFYIPSDLKSFSYKEKTYNIVEESIYLLPTKKEFLMPTTFYYEDNDKPVDFKDSNIGITGKELSLIYDEELYKGLFPFNEAKYNLFIVILMIVSVGSFLIGLFFLIRSHL